MESHENEMFNLALLGCISLRSTLHKNKKIIKNDKKIYLSEKLKKPTSGQPYPSVLLLFWSSEMFFFIIWCPFHSVIYYCNLLFLLLVCLAFLNTSPSTFLKLFFINGYHNLQACNMSMQLCHFQTNSGYTLIGI